MQLVKSEFQAWLEGLPADKHLFRCTSKHCILVEFLQSKLWGEFCQPVITVGPFKYQIHNAFYKHPQWAELFVARWDRLDSAVFSTPADALTLLAGIAE